VFDESYCKDKTLQTKKVRILNLINYNDSPLLARLR
jgi:hypothetical protein